MQQLVDYEQVHGDCNVPREYKENPQLGEWVGTQRRSTSMSEERRKRLNSIGFTWKFQEAQFAFHWGVRFQQLVEYKRFHGDCNVPVRYKVNPQLGKWVIHQRQDTGKMSDERRKQLNSIRFPWSLKRGPKQGRARPSPKEGPNKKKVKLDNEAPQEDTAFESLCKDTLKSWDDRLTKMKRKYFQGENKPSRAQLRVVELLNNSHAPEIDLLEMMKIINLELLELEGKVVKSTIKL